MLPCMVCIAMYGLPHAGTEVTETLLSEVTFDYHVSHHNLEAAMHFVATSCLPPTKGGDLVLCHPEEVVAMFSKMATTTRYMQDSLLDKLARSVLLVYAWD